MIGSPLTSRTAAAGLDVGHGPTIADRGVQYVSIKYTERSAEADLVPSVDSVGDSCDVVPKARFAATPSPRRSTGSTKLN